MKSSIENKNGSPMRLSQSLAIDFCVTLMCLATTSGMAQTYTVLHSFDTDVMEVPYGNIVQDDNGVLYGTTYAPWYSGSLYRINPDGSGYTVLRNDNYEFGGGMVVTGKTLYAKTYSPLGGNVFSINTDGTGYVLLKQFSYYSGGEAYTPLGGLTLSGTTLYGTLYYGGDNGGGALFKLDTDGSNYMDLMQFDSKYGGNVCYPDTTLLLSDTTLYGTTDTSGGTVFKIGVDGRNYQKLEEFPAFTGDGSGQPRIRAISGGILYGTTSFGGTSNSGVIFKLNGDGTGYTILKRFTGGIDGGYPWAGVVVSDSLLFGTAAVGGLNGNGVVFKINTDGSGYTVIKHFSGSDGAKPTEALTLSGTMLYGTTQYGGAFSNGVLFSLSIAPPRIASPLQDRTSEVGSIAVFDVDADSPPLSYQWFFAGTNVLTGCTNATLDLINVQFTNSGAYIVVITNLFGAVTSSPAMLNVIQAVEHRLLPAISLKGEAGSSLKLDYASKLTPAPDWNALDTVSLSSPSQFYFDLSEPLPPQRFYRVSQTGNPSVIPSLNLPGVVPAITLTGNVGDTLQLDYINQSGPTDAWITLDTVTLTNTSQLYFDVSSIGQPPRLWRIVPVP
jgi:uncharacterized repeat protein (TIGR03803 family)